MLLPSGRSNSDVHPINSTTKTAHFSTRTSSPQLSINSGHKKENGTYAQKASISMSSSSPMSTTVTTGEEVPVSEKFTNSSSAPNSTLSTPASNHNQPYTIQMHSSSVSATGNALPSNSPGSQSETGTTTAGNYTNSPKVTFLSNGGISSSAGALSAMTTPCLGNWGDIDRHLEAVQTKLKDGWSVHLGKEGRLYYCK